jgi:hypothetical protein
VRAVHRRNVEWKWSIMRPPPDTMRENAEPPASAFSTTSPSRPRRSSHPGRRNAWRFSIGMSTTGNGTQTQFWDDPDVLFVFVHQWPHYPGSSIVNEIGGPNAPDRTVNFPLPAGCGDADYLSIIDSAFTPLARAFLPYHILVSAGLDAHEGDPLGGMRLTAEGFAGMASRLRALAAQLCSGRPSDHRCNARRRTALLAGDRFPAFRTLIFIDPRMIMTPPAGQSSFFQISCRSKFGSVLQEWLP